MSTMRFRLALLATFVLAGVAPGQEDHAGALPDRAALVTQVEALRAPDVAWRKIPWRTCLLDACAAGRQAGKPLLAWVFIDRPVDDARC